jgi:hypothetical protein
VRLVAPERRVGWRYHGRLFRRQVTIRAAEKSKTALVKFCWDQSAANGARFHAERDSYPVLACTGSSFATRVWIGWITCGIASQAFEETKSQRGMLHAQGRELDDIVRN